MNPEKIEKIFQRIRPGWRSGYDFPRRTGYIDWRKNYGAISWGCVLSMRLAAAGCPKWAEAAWVWAVDCYHWRAELEGVSRALTDAEYDKFLSWDKHIEINLLSAAQALATWGIEGPWTEPAHWSYALTADEFALINDGNQRGKTPRKSLQPPRSRSHLIKIQAAAQTLSEICKSKTLSKG